MVGDVEGCWCWSCVFVIDEAYGLYLDVGIAVLTRMDNDVATE